LGNNKAGEGDMPDDKKPDHLKLVASASPEDIFDDVEALRKVAEHKVQRRVVQVNMAVRKPPDNAHFQCHPDPAQRIEASLLFDKEERDVYFVAPLMMNHPLTVPRLRRVTIATTYLWPSGQIFLWPVPFSAGKGSVKCWKTARRAFEIAGGLAADLDPPGPRWAQLCWNEALQDYDLATAENINMAPIWTEGLKLSASLKLGFRDRTIADEDHHSADLPSKFDRFREVWGWDTEFRPDANHRPGLVTLFAKEIRSGRTVRLRLADLIAAGRLPFGAETLTAGVATPANVLCTYAEASTLINGLEIDGLTEKRPSLLEACDLFGIAQMDKERKDAARDLILQKSKSEYASEEWVLIEGYNAEDVETDIKLFAAEAPAIDLEAALFRGRYSKAVACMEHVGMPVDAANIGELSAVWPDLRLHYIRELDSLRLYDDEGRFCEDRFAGLIDARGWFWPRTEKSGKYRLDARTFGKMVAKHPELRATQRLRDQIAELRLGAFVNTIGADGYSRCPLMPYWTRTGRNQPRGRGLVYLLSLPAWVHGCIRPPEGYGIACLDWVAQEIGIGAGLSRDPAMIADFLSGDPHLKLAIRAGLAPEDATKASHGSLRKAIKPVSLGIPYGITEWGVSRQTGKSRRWSREVLAATRHMYRVYFDWQAGTVAQAVFDRRIVSPLGFPMAVHQDTPQRTLKNYMHQAAGTDMMRLAAVAGTAAGVTILNPVHDAFWIMAPIGELDDAIATMARIMVRSSAVVTGGLEVPVEVSAKVCWPHCLGDVRHDEDRGQALWLEIKGLARDISRRRAV
jgi:hypothetical protein